MEVWVVTSQYYDTYGQQSTTLIGVFTSRELAQKQEEALTERWGRLWSYDIEKTVLDKISTTP